MAAQYRTFFAVPLLGMAALVALASNETACLTDACKGEYSVWGNLGQGNLIERDVWQSTPIDGEWVPFPHAGRVDFVHPLGRQPYEILVWISAEKRPLPSANFTLGGGDVASVYRADLGVVGVQNGTCADYYVRVVLRAAPSPLPDVSDAGADVGLDGGDGGLVEAGTD
jgi:hypothetical protein